MKTKQHLTACFKASLLLVASVAARAELPPLLPTPAPQQVLLQLSATDALLTSFNTIHVNSVNFNSVNAQPDSEEAALPSISLQSIRTLLQRARETGDQRLLGQALHQLNAVTDEQNTIDIRLLRANVYQALHRFDPAINEIKRVLQTHPDHPHALLMYATLHTVRGDYKTAQATCKALFGKVPNLLSGSCSSTVLARQGQARRAYTLLEHLYTQTAQDSNNSNSDNSSNSDITHYAEVSLAEIAEQLGDPVAAQWWQKARHTQPNDLYTRIGAARNALHRRAYNDVIQLSEHFADIDALQLLRAQALQYRSPAEAIVLRQQLATRVETARARGDTLHARDQAAILLDLLEHPDEALVLAEQNWAQQREPEDTALLLRSALAAKRWDVYAGTQAWLKTHNQWHARYPTSATEALQ